MILASITHDVRANTLEAVWLEEMEDEAENVIGFVRAKCRNYSVEQKDEFAADVGEGADKYIALAGW